MKKMLGYIIFFLLLNLFIMEPLLAENLGQRLRGKILLQTEENGDAWYINPTDLKKYYLGTPNDSFNAIKQLSLGISNANFERIKNNVPSNLSGKILLKVEDNGMAYYVDGTNKELYYLGRPQDAFNIMRSRGMGISNSDLSKIQTGQIDSQNKNSSPANSFTTNNRDSELASLEIKAFNVVNKYREEQGLEKLTWNNKIADVARQHSNDMARGKTKFGHDGLESRAIAIKVSIPLNIVAENVAYNYGYDNPSNQAFVGWLDSPPHKATIIGNYKQSGMGVEKSTNGSYFFTQLFVN